MKKSQDQSFDALMNKFANNIYGSSKGKLRHQVLLHQMAKYINLDGKSLDIIDVGGGTGIMSQEMLAKGHNVLFNDISEQAVDYAKYLLVNYQSVVFTQQNLNQLNHKDEFDVVICHAVMEWLSEPLSAIHKLIEFGREGAIVSMSFFNKDAHRFGNILYGNFDYVDADMQNKNTVRLNPNHAIQPQMVLSELATLPVEIIATAGVRCFHDYLKDRDKQTLEYERIKQLELQYCELEPYKWLGKYFHVLFKITEKNNTDDKPPVY
jgi:S-adenosylmethionine-dependent methyltransferase